MSSTLHSLDYSLAITLLHGTIYHDRLAISDYLTTDTPLDVILIK
jgi:hypothetical protein